MKKSRKLLSVVLSLLVVIGSLPVVYTAAADAVALATGDEGTIDNPTTPVSAEGVFSYDDLYKLNIDVENTSYTFYQTMNDEYFTYTQILGLQQRNDVPVSGRTFIFEGVNHYTGGTNATTTNSDGSAQGTDLMEVPAITTNTTTEFLNTYYVNHAWSAINSNASDLGSAPSNVQLQGSAVDLTGCKNYSWQDKYVVKGHSAASEGEINTGYYEAYKWNWSTSDASAAFELRLQTSVRILDARKLAEEIEEAEEILANPEKYTDAYISSVEATLNTIPEDLRDFSEVYDQATIDKYAEMLEDVSLNSADYREFNSVYESLSSITNARDGFTEDSYQAFKEEIERINQNLPKNLDYTKQSVVDEATQALKNAYNILVTKGSASGSTYTETTQDIKFTVQNEFNLIQVKDDQELSYTQFWSIDRRNLESKDSRRMFYSVIDSSSAFTSRFVDSSVDTVSSLSANAIDGSLSSALIFTCWDEVLEDGSTNPSTEVINRTNHTIDGNYSGFEKDKAYYIENSPVFKGLSASETGAHTFTYNQTIYLNWQQNYIVYTKNNYSQTSFTTTINITDARALVKAVEEAKAIIANPGDHSDSYISALRAAVDAVPIELIRGIEYYTQAEVDSFLNEINSVHEGCADYTEFDRVFEELAAMKNDDSTYTEESFNAFMKEIYDINKNLHKNLPASEQATVDAATEALHKATHHLVYYKLNSDNVFTEEDIPEDLGYSPFSFSLSSTNYEFMQVSDGQQFAIRTDFTAKNVDSSYTVSLLSLGFSTVNADNKAAICDARETPDKGCHNASNVPVSADGYTFFDLATFASTSGTITGIASYAADDAGDTGEFNSWVNTEGTALSSNGVLTDGVELELSDSSAYATYVYTSTSDAASGEVNICYAFRLGWSYEQFWGENVRRHVHIPVYLKITDARELHNLYKEVEDILNGETEEHYTLDSLVPLYQAFIQVPSDMAYGEEYYTQAEVNEMYALLSDAKATLEQGADYSEFFEAELKAQEIINSDNKDSDGNALYDREAYDTFVKDASDIMNSLPTNLHEDQQAQVDNATAGLNDALSTLEQSKHADYSAFNEAFHEIQKIIDEENATPGTYTQETFEDVLDAYNQAVALDKNLYSGEQETVDAVTKLLEDAASNKKYKADYSEFDDAYSQVEDIVNNPNKYTDATVEAAEKALEEADKLNKDLPDTAENRVTIENAANALKDVINNAKETADYSAFEDAYEKVKEIAENKDGKYTDASADAAQKALEEADKLEKELPPESQTTVDEATNALQSVIDNAKEKADYSGLDKALEDAKEIVNAPEGTYTEETVKKAQDAIDAAEALDKDLEKNDGNQQKIDDVIKDLVDSVVSAEEKADYTDYNNAKDDADNLVNDDGNGNPIYDEDAFNEYKEAISDIDSKLDKDLSSDDQSIVDDATAELEDLKANLEDKKYYAVTFKDAEGNVLGTSAYVNGDTFGNLTAPVLPEDTDTIAYVGWIYADGSLAKADDVVTGELDVTVASEDKKLIAKDESGVAIDEITSFVSGIEAGTTVEEVLSKFDNDELVIEIKTYEGVDLASEELVGTGSTITLKSKYTGIVYETRMFIIMGDVDGDGDVDTDDYEISKSVGHGAYEYAENHSYFFVANDIDENGFINAIDAFYIGRMRNS